jgi:hypothetical protein
MNVAVLTIKLVLNNKLHVLASVLGRHEAATSAGT